MDAVTENHLDFADRVKRIEKMRAQAQQLLWVGVDEVYAMPCRTRQPRGSALRRLVLRLLQPVALVVALAIGLSAEFAGEVVLFHLQEGAAVPVEWRLGLGLALALGLGFLFQETTWLRVLAQASGAGAGFAALPQAVQSWPALFESLTSAQWVARMAEGQMALAALN